MNFFRRLFGQKSKAAEPPKGFVLHYDRPHPDAGNSPVVPVTLFVMDGEQESHAVVTALENMGVFCVRISVENYRYVIASVRAEDHEKATLALSILRKEMPGLVHWPDLVVLPAEPPPV
ncbi:hypothetical protein [Limnoglobus roseus]|nr:hypothetical protein [Limnoglobus roseus]